jgi:hypothetical protein
MPCSKYKGKQLGLCYQTHEWKDWSKVKEYRQERKEHPSLSESSIKQIVKDHFKPKK